MHIVLIHSYLTGRPRIISHFTTEIRIISLLMKSTVYFNHRKNFRLKCFCVLNIFCLVEGDSKLYSALHHSGPGRTPLHNSKIINNPKIGEEIGKQTVQCDMNTTSCFSSETNMQRAGKKGSPKEILVKVGKCFNKSSLVDVVFKTGKKGYTLYTVCHNEDIDLTYYVKSYILGAKLNSAETGDSRPSFQEGQFFKYIHADKSYSKEGQTKTLEELLGSKKMATDRIKGKGNQYFARGHLFPNADPILSVERQATFYYINTFPQWQPMNQGNWNALEAAARKLAKSARANFTIWSGTYGTMELPNDKMRNVQIWFGRDDAGNFAKPSRLPVPYLAWKIIHYEECNQAVVIVQINNPWDDLSNKSPFCESICDQISWVKWDTQNMNKGYTYCCNAATFHKIVSYAPKLGGNIKLLNNIPKGKKDC